MSFTLGNLPERVRGFHGDPLDNYFRVARGRSAQAAESTRMLRRRRSGRDDQVVRHQLPLHRARVQRDDRVRARSPRVCWRNWPRRKAQGVKAKPVIIGPVTYLWLGKAKDDSDRLALLPRLLPVYAELLDDVWRRRASNGCRSTSRCSSPNSIPRGRRHSHRVPRSSRLAASSCCSRPISASLQENLDLAANAARGGLHVDAVNARAAKCDAARPAACR